MTLAFVSAGAMKAFGTRHGVAAWGGTHLTQSCSWRFGPTALRLGGDEQCAWDTAWGCRVGWLIFDPIALMARLVPETGIEPVRPLFTKAADFKSAVSTNFTTRAMN